MSDVSSVPARSDGNRFGFATFVLHLWAVVALAISNAAMVLSIAAVPFAVRGNLRREAERMGRFSEILNPLGFYVLVGLASITFSLDSVWSLAHADEMLGLVTLPLALFWLRDAEWLRKVLDGVVIVAALAALWGLGQFLTGYGDLGQRIRGPFSHYMTFAGVLLLANLVLIARFACRKPRLGDWRWGACAVITIALFGSLTRSSWVALALTLFVLALLRRPKSVLVWMPVAVLGLALLAAPVRQRIASIVDLQDPSNYDRLSMLDAGLEMVAERPVLGLGPGMPERLYPIYRPLAAPRHSVPHLHNTYLQVAAEGGLVGLGAYLWLIGAALLAAYRGYRRCLDEPGRPGVGRCFEELYLGSFLALIGFSLAGLFEANWLDTEVLRLTLVLMATPFILTVQEGEIGSSVGQ
ncbi:MAG: hypothetical protein GY769_23525 [bacterium]|nr:hypothetical protein [bacterium]